MTTPASHPSTNGAAARSLDWSRRLAEHESWLKGVIRARLGESQAVEEVWQEVALAAISQKSPILDPEKEPAWLYRVAVTLAIRHRRQSARRRKGLAKLAFEIGGSMNGAAHNAANTEEPLDWLLREERRQAVRSALSRLAGRDAEILLLKYHEHWSYRRIAETLGVSESAVDARVFRARDRLRRELANWIDQDTER